MGPKNAIVSMQTKLLLLVLAIFIQMFWKEIKVIILWARYTADLHVMFLDSCHAPELLKAFINGLTTGR